MKMEYTNLGLILALRRAEGLQLWLAPTEKEWWGEQLLVSDFPLHPHQGPP